MEIKTLQNAEGKQAELTRHLIEASQMYYGSHSAILSDMEFDRLLEQLRQLEEESGFAYEGSPTQNVGAATVSALPKAKHAVEALSLDKVKYADRKSLKDWLGDKFGVLSWKMDGSTIVNTYENGSLVSSVTRGNGVEGSVITHNALFFKGLPIHIPYKGRLVVRGEAVMTYQEFNRINEETDGEYENPRNLANATIQMLSAAESKKREIQFYAFKLVEPAPGASIDIPGEFLPVT